MPILPPEEKSHFPLNKASLGALEKENLLFLLAILNGVSVFPYPNHYTDRHIPDKYKN